MEQYFTHEEKIQLCLISEHIEHTYVFISHLYAEQKLSTHNP